MILVTGGAGCIGSAVGRTIISETSDSVINVDKLTYAGNIDNLKNIQNSDYTFIKGDICDEKTVLTVFNDYNFHLHIPEGATPKDGPSAGVTMITSLVSLISQRKVKSKLAMTGEITLRGKVLPVGGIKEKILAAKRAKISSIILPADNKKNVDEIDKKYLKGLNFFYVENILEVV